MRRPPSWPRSPGEEHGLVFWARVLRQGGTAFPYATVFHFRLATALWNLLGAGGVGFPINLPVVNYFEHGSFLTAAHGHAALMGVYGNLGLALALFALRGLTTPGGWAEKAARLGFRGLNLSLASMLILTLVPVGVGQLAPALGAGFWAAREPVDSVNERIQKEGEYDPDNPAYEMLRHLAEHLVAAEKHHAREEEVRFPELEKRGITGPPRIMKLEHNDLRPRKHRLLELAEAVSAVEFARFREELAQLTAYVGFLLRDHIFKENTILYPTALEVIPDEATCAEMKSRCDAIGHCCFTPAA